MVSERERERIGESATGDDGDRDGANPLERLRWQKRKKRIPLVQQLEWTDCGAACLTMVLRYHGSEVSLDRAREVVGVDRDGVSALSILRGAEWFGMRGRGLKVEVEDLAELPPGAILHWDFSHFVVLERVTRRGIEILDPATGRRLLSPEAVSRSFTGVVLTFEPADGFKPEARGKSKILRHLAHIFDQARLLRRVLTTSVLLRLFGLSLPLLTAAIVDRVVPRADLHLLWVVGIGLLMILAFQLLSSLIRAHLLLQLRTNLDTRMTLGFIGHLVTLPYVFFQRRSAGDLMMRVNSNATIREILTANTLSGLLDGSLVVLYLGLIFAFSWQMGLLVLLLGAIQVVVFLSSRRRYRELTSESLEKQAKSQGYLVQVMAGIETLKLAGAEARAVERYSNLYVDELNVSLERGRLSAVVDSMMAFLAVGSPLTILSYGAVQVVAGNMTLGTMLALNALAAGFLAPLAALVASGLSLQQLGSYVERIDDVLDTAPEQDITQVSPAPVLQGGIEAAEVSFRYGPNAPLVVKQVSFAIRPGSSVAIVGRSGSGKLTLAHLLLGMHRPTDGRVLYDGNDLATMQAGTVRRQLGIVPQHPYLFGASVRENIALGAPDASEEEVLRAAELACVHDEIAALPMGYDTIVADGGASLSGGQRQRIALARALLLRPAILLLDEATSSLDTASEARVMENLERLRCTRVLIAHRLSTIAAADTILVMEKGELVERGTHEQLLAAGGAYGNLVAAQASVTGAGAERRKIGGAR